MDLKLFWKGLETEQKESLAAGAGTSVGYLNLIFGGHQRPGSDLAKRLEEKIVGLKLAPKGAIPKSKFRPDLWGQAA